MTQLRHGVPLGPFHFLESYYRPSSFLEVVIEKQKSALRKISDSIKADGTAIARISATGTADNGLVPAVARSDRSNAIVSL
jgi:hypothetical protein